MLRCAINIEPLTAPNNELLVQTMSSCLESTDQCLGSRIVEIEGISDLNREGLTYLIPHLSYKTRLISKIFYL